MYLLFTKVASGPVKCCGQHEFPINICGNVRFCFFHSWRENKSRFWEIHEVVKTLLFRLNFNRYHTRYYVFKTYIHYFDFRPLDGSFDFRCYDRTVVLRGFRNRLLNLWSPLRVPNSLIWSVAYLGRRNTIKKNIGTELFFNLAFFK